MQYLRQSTAATEAVGPILDSAGAEYTGAVIGDLTITKNGTSAAMAAAATLTHIANGHYTLVFTTGNTDTCGRVTIHCNKSTYQMPPVRFTVVEEVVYDSLFAASAVGYQVPIWAAAGSTVNLSATTISTLTTYTGNTPQTGDVFPLASTEIADIKAKTDLIPAAPASTTNITAGTITTVGGNVTGSVGSVVGLTAANLDAAVSSRMATYTQPTGFLAATFPSDPADQSLVIAATNTILADTNAVKVVTDKLATSIELDGAVYRYTTNALELAPTGGSAPTVGQIADEVRIELATELGRIDAAISTTALEATLGALVTTVGVAGLGLSAVPKTGYKLASDGLDVIAITAPAGVAGNFREMVVQTWRRFFSKSTLTATELKTFADNGSTVLTTQTVSDDATTQTQGTSS